MKKGAFIVGAKYGKGFITCRGETNAWSAPANVRVERYVEQAVLLPRLPLSPSLATALRDGALPPAPAAS